MGTRIFGLTLPNLRNTQSYFDYHRHKNSIDQYYLISLFYSQSCFMFMAYKQKYFGQLQVFF